MQDEIEKNYRLFQSYDSDIEKVLKQKLNTVGETKLQEAIRDICKVVRTDKSFIHKIESVVIREYMESASALLTAYQREKIDYLPVDKDQAKSKELAERIEKRSKTIDSTVQELYDRDDHSSISPSFENFTKACTRKIMIQLENNYGSLFAKRVDETMISDILKECIDRTLEQVQKDCLPMTTMLKQVTDSIQQSVIKLVEPTQNEVLNTKGEIKKISYNELSFMNEDEIVQYLNDSLKGVDPKDRERMLADLEKEINQHNYVFQKRALSKVMGRNDSVSAGKIADTNASAFITETVPQMDVESTKKEAPQETTATIDVDSVNNSDVLQPEVSAKDNNHEKITRLEVENEDLRQKVEQSDLVIRQLTSELDSFIATFEDGQSTIGYYYDSNEELKYQIQRLEELIESIKESRTNTSQSGPVSVFINPTAMEKMSAEEKLDYLREKTENLSPTARVSFLRSFGLEDSDIDAIMSAPIARQTQTHTNDADSQLQSKPSTPSSTMTDDEKNSYLTSRIKNLSQEQRSQISQLLGLDISEVVAVKDAQLTSKDQEIADLLQTNLKYRELNDMNKQMIDAITEENARLRGYISTLQQQIQELGVDFSSLSDTQPPKAY